MKRVVNRHRSAKKRALGALGFGSTALLSTIAIAASSTSVVLYTAAGNSLTGSKAVQWLEPVASLLSLTALTGSAPVTRTIPTPRMMSPIGSTSVVPAGTGSSTARPMKLGMNLIGADYYNNSRPFMNLLAGSVWYLQSDTAGTVGMPESRMDVLRNVVTLNSGEYATRVISPPTQAFRGATVDVVCRWEGKATVRALGVTVKNVRVNSNSLSFTFVPQGVTGAILQVSKLDPQAPFRKADCREKDADPNALFEPTFLAEAKKYNTLRFMKWQPAVESNAAVTWAARTTPASGVVRGPDSIPVEYMVQLANETKTNPWFCMPWNADDDYIRKFATYVRDNLDPTLTAHVETSNEVWNWVYPVTKQASTEGLAKNLSTDAGVAMLLRYAERTGEVMDIWTDVFAGKSNRLVRVLASQNLAWGMRQQLKFRNTATKVDAVAIAPYFFSNMKAGELASTGVDKYFNTNVVTMIDNAMLATADTQKLAKEYGLRMLAYEAGQHLTSASDLDQLGKVQRDPRMGQAYTRYLNRWRDQFGDLMVLFTDYGPINQYGSWGMREYIGQPLTEAPKANAVELFRQSYITK